MRINVTGAGIGGEEGKERRGGKVEDTEREKGGGRKGGRSHTYYDPDREGGNKRCFCPSVRLSVRPSRTQRIIREPKGLACPHLG